MKNETRFNENGCANLGCLGIAIFVIIIIIFSTMLFSCSTSQYIQENKMYITRKYCGDYIEQITIDKRFERIYTTQAIFQIRSGVINVPVGTRCYIKYRAEIWAGQRAPVWVLYFTWDGTKDLFMLRQNVMTGEINH